MITWEDIVKSIEAGISNIDELFSVGVPTELGEDQKVTLTEPPLVPQSNTTSAPDIVATVNTVLGQPDNNERKSAERYDQDWRIIRVENPDWTDQQVYDEMTRRIDNDLKYLRETQGQEAEESEKLNQDLNFSLADAKQYGYTPDLIQTLAEKLQYNFGTNSSNVVSADYMVSPCSDVYGDSPVTEKEKRAGIHLNEHGIKVDVAGNPLPEEIDKIDYRNRVMIQSLYDELGHIIEGLQSHRENQDNESADSDSYKFEPEGVLPDGTPAFRAIIQRSGNADNSLFEFNMGGYGVRIVDDRAKQKALSSAKLQEWARGMEFLGLGYSAGGLVPKVAAIAGKVIQGSSKAVAKFGKNVENHLAKVEGFSQKRGISGGHNLNEFETAINANNAKVVKEVSHQSIEGIKEVKYQIPTLDAAGNPTGGYKAQTFTKTVYDSRVISDAQMAEWGKQAAQEALSAGRIGPNGRVWEGFAPNGLKFRGYIEADGTITNFFPVMN